MKNINVQLRQTVRQNNVVSRADARILLMLVEAECYEDKTMEVFSWARWGADMDDEMCADLMRCMIDADAKSERGWDDAGFEEDSIKGDSIKEDSIKGDSIKEDSSKGDSIKGDSIKEDSGDDSDDNEPDEDEICLVMKHAKTTRDKAVASLKRHRNVVDAILDHECC